MNALLAIVEQEPATLDPQQASPPKGTESNARRWASQFIPKRATGASARPDGTVEVSGKDARAAQQEAARLYERFEVVDGYQTYSLLGQKKVVLVVRPLAITPATGTSPLSLVPFASAEVLWNRSTLRSLGVPSSVMKRLPLDDPYTQEDWELMLLSILEREIEASNLYSGAGTVNGAGARGAAAILAGIEAGIPPGTLELGGITVPATGSSLLAALRSGMPRRFPDPPATPPPGLQADQEQLVASDIELPAPPQVPLEEVEQVYGAFEGDSAELLVESLPSESSGADAESTDTSAGSLTLEDDPVVAVEAAEDVIASGALAELMEAASESHPAGASDETRPIPVVRVEPAASSRAVAVSGEVTGKRPRAARPRSVPGSEKTPYPAPQED